MCPINLKHINNSWRPSSLKMAAYPPARGWGVISQNKWVPIFILHALTASIFGVPPFPNLIDLANFFQKKYQQPPLLRSGVVDNQYRTTPVGQ